MGVEEVNVWMIHGGELNHRQTADNTVNLKWSSAHLEPSNITRSWTHNAT